MSYSIKFKKEVILFAEANSVKDARRKYEIYDSTINLWIKNREDIFNKEEGKTIIHSIHKFDIDNYEISPKTNGLIKKKCKDRQQARIFVFIARLNRHGVRQRGYTSGNINALDIWKIALKQRLRCAISGIQLTRSNMSIDHIKPLSKGGFDEIGNIQLVDKRINEMKNDMDLKELVGICRNIAETNPNII